MTWEQLLAYISGLIADILNQVHSAISGTVSSLGSYGSQIYDTIKGYIVNLLSGIGDYMSSLVSTVVNKIGALVENIAPIISEVVTRVAGAIHDLIDPLVDTIMETFNQIKGAIKYILDKIGDAFAALWEAIQQKISDVMTAVYDFIKGIADKVVDFFTDLWERAKAFYNSVVEYVRGVFNDVIAYFRGIAQQVYDTVRGWIERFAAFVRDTYDKVVKAITDEWQKLTEGAESIIETVNKRIGDLADAFRDSATKLGDFLASLSTDQIAPFVEAVKGIRDTFAASPPTPEMTQALASLDRFVKGPWTSELFGEFFSDGWTTLAPSSALGETLFFALVSFVAAGAFTANAVSIQAQVLQQDLALQKPWMAMDASEVRAAWLRGQVSKETALDQIRRGGYSEWQAQAMLYNAYTPISPDQLIALWLRGELPDGELYKELNKLGIEGNGIAQLRSLGQIIPPVSDLISMAVKEAFSPDVAAAFGQFQDFPEEFGVWAKKQGLSEDWAKKYWAAHWSLPSPQMGFEMFQRGIIGEEELKKLLRALDIMPHWRDLLIKLSYHPLTRVDIRRMHKAGVVSDGELPKRYQDIGYSPADAADLARWTIQTNKGTDKPRDVELGKLTVSAVLDFYENGLLPRARAVDLLVTLGATPQAAELYVANADLRRHQDESAAQVSRIIEEARLGEIGQQQAAAMIDEIQLTDEQRTRALTALDRAVGKTTKLPSEAAAANFWKAGFISDQEYRELISLHGYSPRFVEMFLGLLKRKKSAETEH